jgi:hypothetical protein
VVMQNDGGDQLDRSFGKLKKYSIESSRRGISYTK